MHDPDNKTGHNFWIGALAFSVLLLATTFALLAAYLAEIKENTAVALSRADLTAQRLNSIDMEIAAIHHHIMAEKAATDSTAPAAMSSPDTAVPPPPPLGTATVPEIQPPAMSAPETVAPAPMAQPVPSVPSKP